MRLLSWLKTAVRVTAQRERLLPACWAAFGIPCFKCGAKPASKNTEGKIVIDMDALEIKQVEKGTALAQLDFTDRLT